MGYTKVVYYGDIIEIYNYQKDVHPKEIRTQSRRARSRNPKSLLRSKESLKRAKTSFYRLVCANLHAKGTPSFITLTNFEEVSIVVAYEYLRSFTKNLRRLNKNLAFITVPEWQKNGRIHFHCLFWGIEEKILKEERKIRFIQRQWARGYADVLIARDASIRIAGYMAKYMSKAYEDRRLLNRRAYSSSYNVNRPIQAGGNSLSHRIIPNLPEDKTTITEYTYSTAYLGQCTFTQLKVKYDS